MNRNKNTLPVNRIKILLDNLVRLLVYLFGRKLDVDRVEDHREKTRKCEKAWHQSRLG